MTNGVLSLVLVGASLPPGPFAFVSGQQNTQAAERQVGETLTRLASSYAANDLETYFAFFADDMTVWWAPRAAMTPDTEGGVREKLARIHREDRRL